MINRLTKKKEFEWFKNNMCLESLNIDNLSYDELASKLSLIESSFNKDKYNNFINKFLRDKIDNKNLFDSKAQLIINEIIHHQ